MGKDFLSRACARRVVESGSDAPDVLIVGRGADQLTARSLVSGLVVSSSA